MQIEISNTLDAIDPVWNRGRSVVRRENAENPAKRVAATLRRCPTRDSLPPQLVWHQNALFLLRYEKSALRFHCYSSSSFHQPLPHARVPHHPSHAVVLSEAKRLPHRRSRRATFVVGGGAARRVKWGAAARHGLHEVGVPLQVGGRCGAEQRRPAAGQSSNRAKEVGGRLEQIKAEQ